MKRFLILLIIAHCVLLLYGQSALVSIDSTSRWIRGYANYVIENDTTINNYTYKKLITYTDSSFKRYVDTDYIREDTTGKVFLFKYGEEVVAYDFNLAFGDTFILDFPGDDSSMLLYTVDSVGVIILADNNAYDALYVKVYSYYDSNLGERYINDILVRGIGSLKFGIVQPMLFGTGGSISPLVCYHKGDELVYLNPEYKSCYSYVSVPKLNVDKNIINLYPIGESIMCLKSQSNGNLSFYTLDGRLVHKEQITQFETQICLPETGILLYRFTTAKGEVQTGKVMVK